MEEGRAEGLAEAREETLKDMILMFLKDKGTLSSVNNEKLHKEKDFSKLEMWVKLAADSKFVEEFEQNM